MLWTFYRHLNQHHIVQICSYDNPIQYSLYGVFFLIFVAYIHITPYRVFIVCSSVFGQFFANLGRDEIRFFFSGASTEPDEARWNFFEVLTVPVQACHSKDQKRIIKKDQKVGKF